ncbi:hypothetical protein SUGI_0103880 [Cryptomeria japonica]|nr:hypothetical protein SUGI_0103880 [Cryptomeria japonica]
MSTESRSYTKDSATRQLPGMCRSGRNLLNFHGDFPAAATGIVRMEFSPLELGNKQFQPNYVIDSKGI